MFTARSAESMTTGSVIRAHLRGTDGAGEQGRVWLAQGLDEDSRIRVRHSGKSIIIHHHLLDEPVGHFSLAWDQGSRAQPHEGNGHSEKGLVY
jgi:hypothetical protein